MSSLLGRPWIVVLAVAVLVAAPVLVVGQKSEDDTRARLSAAQITSASQAADVIASDVQERINHVGVTLRLLTSNPTPEASLIGAALERNDTTTMQSLTDTVYQANVSTVRRVYIATRPCVPLAQIIEGVREGRMGLCGGVGTIGNGQVVAASPPETGLIGKRLSDITGERGAAVQQAVTGGLPQTPGTTSYVFSDEETAPSSVAIASGIRFFPAINPNCGGACARLSRATIVAEIDVPRMFAAAARPSLTAPDDAYLLDASGRLIGRAGAPVNVPLRDLSGDPFVQLASISDRSVRPGVSDPITAQPRILASAALPLAVQHQPSVESLPVARIIVSHDTSVIDRETDTVLAQLAAARIALVLLLLAGTYILALASRQLARAGVDRERLRLARDLHDLLGRSLSVIAIKSQLAKRLAPAGDVRRAVDEIGDVERIARESLDDVRHAVDGHRQPSVEAELAGARSALRAAGIVCTVESSAGPLVPTVDTALAWAIREGITNVIRHGHATSCEIRLSRSNGEARLEIVNDGPVANVLVTGNGLRGLRERAADRGGSADAGPLPSGGFQLRVTLPLRSS